MLNYLMSIVKYIRKISQIYTVARIGHIAIRNGQKISDLSSEQRIVSSQQVNKDV